MSFLDNYVLGILGQETLTLAAIYYFSVDCWRAAQDDLNCVFSIVSHTIHGFTIHVVIVTQFM